MDFSLLLWFSLWWLCGDGSFQSSASVPLSDSNFQFPSGSQEIYLLENSSSWPHKVFCLVVDFPDICAFFCQLTFFFFKFKLKFQRFVQFFGQQLCKRGLLSVAGGWAWKRGREAVNYFIKADPCLFILETLSLLMFIFFLLKFFLGYWIQWTFKFFSPTIFFLTSSKNLLCVIGHLRNQEWI